MYSLFRFPFFVPSTKALLFVGVFSYLSTPVLTLASGIPKEGMPNSASIGQSFLSLEAAIAAAQQNDIWLTGNKHSQEAIESASVFAGTLPDPKMSLTFANIPTDSFDFGQEGMTQFKVGVSQMFPRGDSLEIKKKQLVLKSGQFPYQRQDRNAKTSVIVSQLWLDAYRAKESIALIEKDRELFEQLADVAQASYSSGLGKTRQHDIVRAQLEMTRLEDRLTVLKQTQEKYRQQLNEWLDNEALETQGAQSEDVQVRLLQQSPLTRALPNLALVSESIYHSNDSQRLFELISNHPALKVMDKKINVSRAGIELAEQKYRPAWGVSGSYAYRDDDPMGNDRADFFSVGINFDMPIFTAKKQDQQVKTAISRTEAVKTEKGLLIRKMRASYESLSVQLTRLNERKELYHSILLPQTLEQSEASLTAYTNDDGDFAEVVRSRIAQLNAGIDALSINVDRQKIIAKLNYFLTIAHKE
mgnify:CR=1 FL=1